MTLLPGCYQSALAAHVGNETCDKCPVKTACFAGLSRQSGEVLRKVNAKLAARGISAEDRAPVLDRIKDHMTGLFKPERVPLRKIDRVTGMKVKVDEMGIDLRDISDGRNPFPASEKLLHGMTAFILEGYPFKPKDMAEYIGETVDINIKKSSLMSEISRFTKLLTDAGVLLKMEKNISCLA